jgi:hypothetical protein
MNVYRIHIECAGAAEAEALIDPEMVSVIERAPVGNAACTPEMVGLSSLSAAAVAPAALAVAALVRSWCQVSLSIC